MAMDTFIQMGMVAAMSSHVMNVGLLPMGAISSRSAELAGPVKRRMKLRYSFLAGSM
jgi:hypothetical protein